MIGSLFSGTVSVSDLATGRDASRAPLLAAYTPVASHIPARVEDLGGTQTIRIGQLVIVASHRVFMAALNVPVRNGMVITEDGTPNGVYRITGVETRRAIGSMPGFLSVYCEEFAP